MNKKHIQLLIEVLKTVPDSQFDMNYEFHDSRPNKPLNPEVEDFGNDGVTADPIGHLALTKEEKEAGLYFPYNFNHRLYKVNYKSSKGNKIFGFALCSEFLGVSSNLTRQLLGYTESEYLYGKILEDVTPADVIEKLELLLSSGEEELCSIIEESLACS